ncbi:A disintegrin and metalloproteinase with thrombospondin motifs 16 [Lates japonicus]|uniref:A disintegrin and metalloproteinase with thrombospondin motifs 16 n=1 Tax=Lates japonicus TaxID=270547 RepID=A0AAD3MN48_LATJO|nr:A disintegrin and metalloproteinase with thrombospondin motifs 16 [Lates japonicus]
MFARNYRMYSYMVSEERDAVRRLPLNAPPLTSFNTTRTVSRSFRASRRCSCRHQQPEDNVCDCLGVTRIYCITPVAHALQINEPAGFSPADRWRVTRKAGQRAISSSSLSFFVRLAALHRQHSRISARPPSRSHRLFFIFNTNRQLRKLLMKNMAQSQARDFTKRCADEETIASNRVTRFAQVHSDQNNRSTVYQYRRKSSIVGAAVVSGSIAYDLSSDMPKPPEEDAFILPDESSLSQEQRAVLMKNQAKQNLNVQRHWWWWTQKMMDNHGHENITTYVLTVLNN